MDENGKLTILIVADILLGPNGVRTFCETLLGWSKHNAGLRVLVLTPSNDSNRGALPDEGMIGIRPWFRVPNPLYKDMILGLYSRKGLGEIIDSIDGAKVIHIASPGLLGATAASLASERNIPLVGCYHVDTRRQCVEPYFRVRGRIANAIARFLDKRAYGHCSTLCAPSESAARTARKFFKGDVSVIPNAIDLERFCPAENRQGAFRDKYAEDGKVLAVAVGRMAKEKNLDLICEHLLHDDRIKLVFVGDGPYGAQLRNRWNATVTGFLHGDDLNAAYQQADVFVQLSVLETFGLTLAEAMASGLPAIVLRSGGFVGDIQPDNGVEVLDREDLSKLADRCVALVSDSDRHREKSRRVRQLALTLGPDAILPKFEEFHRKVMP